MVICACQEQVGTIIHGNNCCSYLLYDNGYFFAVVQMAVTSTCNREVGGSSPSIPVGSVAQLERALKFPPSPILRKTLYIEYRIV